MNVDGDVNDTLMIKRLSVLQENVDLWHHGKGGRGSGCHGGRGSSRDGGSGVELSMRRHVGDGRGLGYDQRTRRRPDNMTGRVSTDG